METLLKINVNIAERNFPIRIEAENEHIYRKAAKILNDKLLEYRKSYQGLGDKELLGMIAYGYVVKSIKNDDKKIYDSTLEELLEVDKNLTTIIDNLYN